MFDFKKNKSVFLKLLFLSLPFILMEGVLRVYTLINVNYLLIKMVIPACIFTVSWIAVITFVSYFLNKRWGRIFYGLSFALNFILFLTHLVYHSYTGFFFRFNLLNSADEGSEYIWDTVKNANPLIYIVSAVIIALAVLVIIKFPKTEKINFKCLAAVIVLFALINILTPVLLGSANDSLQYDNWKNPRNVYENFNDANKCMQICGLNEYTFKDLRSVLFKKSEKPSSEQLDFLHGIYNKQTQHAVNDKSGIFKDKNVIFLQLEGVDSWLFNPEDMPNAYSLLSNSINFTNHFSYYSGGGSTFNSELAAITGFITPISYIENPYAFNNNTFDNSLPNMLKQSGYKANAFHMNTGEYYIRELNYRNWGFDDYYSLIDDCNYSNENYRLDTEIINNEFFYNKLFEQDGRFIHYIITYTVHTPFNLTGKAGIPVANKLYGTAGERPELGEEEVARLFASETDEMIGLLIQALKDNNLYENTVIVVFSDHYLYTLNDKTILDKYKETSNNLINHTPFFIWSHDLEAETCDKVNSQIDILPTVLNMMGIEYCDETYIGYDIFDSTYNGYVFFSDYSWYDGKHYVENGEVVNGVDADENYIKETNSLINDKIFQNDWTLKYDYFGKYAR